MKKKQKYITALYSFSENIYRSKIYLYYLDFISYRDRKRTVTCVKYYKKTRDNKKDVFKFKIKDYFSEKDIKPDFNVFDDYERSLIKQIKELFKNWSLKKLVAGVRIEAPVFFCDYGKKIDIDYCNDLDYFNKI